MLNSNRTISSGGQTEPSLNRTNGSVQVPNRFGTVPSCTAATLPSLPPHVLACSACRHPRTDGRQLGCSQAVHAPHTSHNAGKKHSVFHATQRLQGSGSPPHVHLQSLAHPNHLEHRGLPMLPEGSMPIRCVALSPP